MALGVAHQLGLALGFRATKLAQSFQPSGVGDPCHERLCGSQLHAGEMDNCYAGRLIEKKRYFKRSKFSLNLDLLSSILAHWDTRMSYVDDAICEEPEEHLRNAEGPANDPDSADLNWKEYNLLSLGISNVFPARFRHTNHIFL